MSSEQEPRVEITYSIDKDLETTIDIVLEDYSEETMIQLCAMLDVLSSEGTYLQTVQVIAENLKTHGKEKELYQVVSHVTAQQTQRVLTETGETSLENKPSTKEKPCIKPSDML
jgi:hypothetical protein